VNLINFTEYVYRLYIIPPRIDLCKERTFDLKPQNDIHVHNGDIKGRYHINQTPTKPLKGYWFLSDHFYLAFHSSERANHVSVSATILNC
jgi:hypothetical protein